MNAIIDITPLETRMLNNLVDLYIETGRPVSSAELKKRYRLKISPANIRNVLHSLEEKGYLFKPHVSAGRIPCDSGYRRYVDDISSVSRPDRRTIEEIKTRIGRDRDDVREVMFRTSRLLGDLTRCMGLMVGVLGTAGKIEKLDVIQLEGRRGLVLLRITGSREKKADIDLGRRFRSHIVTRAVQIMNERIAGCPVREAFGRLETCVREFTGREKDIVQAVAAESDYLFGGSFDIEYYFRGEDDIVGVPELEDPEMLRSLVRLMGERKLMLNLLKGRLDLDMLVTIGSENESDELSRFSLITRRIPGGECEGMLGVLGPTRMRYRRILSLLGGTAEALERL
jgi:heat-inducible transcriptional repressor